MTRAARILAVLCLSAVTWPARGALPPSFGGTVTLPSPGPIASLDPAEADDPLEAALAAAVCDGLYAIDADGRPVPVLADGPPEVEGTVARVRLRPGVMRHGGSPLHAVSVESTLRRAARWPQAGWLLSALATNDRGDPDVRVVGQDVVELHLAGEGVDVARLLAAAPLAMATGRDPRRRPLGTGPFSARFAGSEIRLVAFRQAAEGAPYLDQIRVQAPRSRNESLRAFELGRLDGSWLGESLYGGQPVRPVTSTRSRAVAPVLLVPNRRADVLRDGRTWEAVASRIDRRRLERVGIAPSPALAAGLPSKRLEARPLPSPRITLRMVVVAGDTFGEALGEALAGILDEAGASLRVVAVPASRYDAVIASGEWDLRVAVVTPPLPGPTALVGASLAAAGQIDRARPLARRLGDASAAMTGARDLDALVLGHRVLELWHPRSLQRVRFDAHGRLVLGELAVARSER